MRNPIPTFCMLVISSTASAQITGFVAPHAVSPFGGNQSLLNASLMPAGATVLKLFGPTGNPPVTITATAPAVPELSYSNVVASITQNAWVRHREGAGGTLTGGYRDFRVEDLNPPHGTDRCIRSALGTSSSPDMFEFEFDPPVGHWGGHAYDLESAGSNPGVLRAYDVTDTLIYEAPILFPNANNGNAVANYLGLVSTDTNIARVTVEVGATSSTSNPNTNSMSFTDIRYGPATMRPGQLSTTFANNTWLGADGAIYIDVECLAAGGLTIDELDLNINNASGTPGTIDIYAKPAGDSWAGAAFWAGPLATGSLTSAGPGLPTHVTLSSGIELGAGCSYQLAIVANGFEHAYTNHPQVPDTYENGALRVTTQRSSPALAGPFFYEPRVANVRLYYSPGGSCLDFATVTQLGDGCVVEHSSIYEQFSSGTFDLANSSMMYAPLSGGDGVALVHDPAGTLQPFSTAASNQLSLLDDDQVPVTSLAGPMMPIVLPIVVGSNGWVVPEGGSNNTSSWNASVGSLLANPHTAFYSWKDLNPAAPGGGRVYYEESTAGPLVRGIVTYDGVYEWNTSQANTLQFVCDFITVASGGSTSYELLQVSVIWGAINGDPPLVGYSPGGANADPGSHDLSAITTTSQTDAQDSRLGLRPAIRPAQQASDYDFEVTTTGIPDSSPFPSGLLLHAGIISLTNPNLPLDTLGLPGCWLYASLDVMPLHLIPPGADFTWTVLNVPDNSSSISGFTFYVQSAVFGTTNNAFLGTGALTSNGLECTVGAL